VGNNLPAREPDNGSLDLTKNGESLPVLEAFQKFLDVERRKTRRRIMAVSIVFLVLIAAVGGAAVLVGLMLARQMKQDVKGMRDQVAAVRTETRKCQTDVQNALATFTAETDGLRTEITEAQASKVSELMAKLSAYNDELEKLTATLQAIEEENRLLKGDVVNLKTGFPAFSNDIRRVIQELSKGRSTAAPPVKPAAAAAKPAGKAPTTASPDLIIAVTPADTEGAVPWCIPIPE
jgi:septal ring factor EnvC (AmiA/AmiB activator)